MRPILADGIDIPIVFAAGIIVLVPLMAFEVFVEALILRATWWLPYKSLCEFAFSANCWSLLAGIPTKVLNAFLYAYFMPRDIPGYFARYPLAVGIGSLIYFAVTVMVEGACGFRWQKRRQLDLRRGQIWRGILLANAATYAVLAPLHYYATRPACQIREFSQDTRWTQHPAEKVLMVDAVDGCLKSITLDGSTRETIVPVPMADYLVSPDLNVCLLRGTNGNLYHYRRSTGETHLVWKTDERFFMDQVAFSPSGERAAFASTKENRLEVVEIRTGKRTRSPFVQKLTFEGPSVVWSPVETRLFISGFDNALRLAVSIGSEGKLEISALDGTNGPPVLTSYGRTGHARWWGGDWGVSYSEDSGGDLTVHAWPGLDSHLRIYRELQKKTTQVLTVSVRPGLMHLAGFYFGDVALLDGSGECLFEANGYIYLLDIAKQRLGLVAKADRFILLTERYQKSF